MSLLPYEYFQHWEVSTFLWNVIVTILNNPKVLKTMLQYKFKGFPREPNVNAGMYFIFRARRPNQVITQELWQRAVLPGANINMSMIVSGMSTSATRCLRCKLSPVAYQKRRSQYGMYRIPLTTYYQRYHSICCTPIVT